LPRAATLDSASEAAIHHRPSRRVATKSSTSPHPHMSHVTSCSTPTSTGTPTPTIAET